MTAPQFAIADIDDLVQQLRADSYSVTTDEHNCICYRNFTPAQRMSLGSKLHRVTLGQNYGDPQVLQDIVQDNGWALAMHGTTVHNLDAELEHCNLQQLHALFQPELLQIFFTRITVAFNGARDRLQVNQVETDSSAAIVRSTESRTHCRCSTTRFPSSIKPLA